MARTDTYIVSCCELEDSLRDVMLYRVGRATFYLYLDKLRKPRKPAIAVEFKMTRYALAEIGHGCFRLANHDFIAQAEYNVATNEILLSFYDSEAPRHNEDQYWCNEEPQKANRILLLCH